MGSLRGTSGILKIGFSGYIYYQIETHFALWRMDSDLWITWIFAFIAYDFFYYWFHRISHERQIFWASHVAHHQSEEYNLSTALRQTGTGFFISWIFYIPLFLIGVPSYVMVSVASINLIYQFCIINNLFYFYFYLFSVINYPFSIIRFLWVTKKPNGFFWVF